MRFDPLNPLKNAEVEKFDTFEEMIESIKLKIPQGFYVLPNSKGSFDVFKMTPVIQDLLSGKYTQLGKPSDIFKE